MSAMNEGARVVLAGGTLVLWWVLNAGAQSLGAFSGAPVQGPPPGMAATGEVVADEPDEVSLERFKLELGGHGTWLVHAQFGQVWQPQVAVATPGWQPYGGGGQWVWTQAGWYWQSTYAWGWIPYHYGRWTILPQQGWVWVPGLHWGCHWAPQPPPVPTGPPVVHRLVRHRRAYGGHRGGPPPRMITTVSSPGYVYCGAVAPVPVYGPPAVYYYAPVAPPAVYGPRRFHRVGPHHYRGYDSGTLRNVRRW